MNMVKLVAFDLDGTLLSEEGTISRENRAAVLEAQSGGIKVVISSGRSLHDTQEILKKAEIEATILSGNGAIAFDTGGILKSLVMPGPVVEEIFSLLKADGHYFELYTKDGVTVEKNGKTQLQDEIQRLKAGDASFPVDWATRSIEIQYEQQGLKFVERYEDLNFTEAGIYKIFVFSFDREKLDTFRKKINNRTDISITTSGSAKLEIAHPEANKGAALEFIAAHFGIPMEETAAIGDNLNDLSMFKVAGISIAMGNAEEEVKKHSTYITRDCEEDGVAYGIRKYLL